MKSYQQRSRIPSTASVRSTRSSAAVPVRRPTETNEGTNICVVARCRGRSEREVAAKSCVVVDTASPGNNQVTVKTGDDLSTNKVYTVDRVFGAEADQSMVFDEIVAPIVDDFLAGMNCTIFAYGQTGTGKTYTMSGDDSVVNNSYAHDAGIIPRVLFRLFNDLDQKGLDHAVSCSFIELYNEDLRDLLDDGDGKKVRIFDDAAKKSVTVQGLAECHFTSAIAGIQILQSGLRKRQVAATKINDLSSRSHTIFTLNVAFDRDGAGESITRAKINLVDLAGSENIGKSGAQNARAREAGMINQSLLTLGRVINALVDRSPHIPYRESKLTRLLQDSLGGRTKTCIIATVSPALVNIEETLSTLEYASRAKNIKNKPQTNNPSQKKTTLGEFSAELEKMRKDLVATRKKNGIFVDQDNYKELMAEKESQTILVNDQQRKLGTVERQLRAAREIVEDTKQQLVKVNRELETTTKDLGGTLLNLENMGGKLKSTKSILKQESILQRAHTSSEQELQSVGRELISTLDQTIRDVNTLHDRLQLKFEYDERAKEVIVEARQESTSHVQSLKRRLNQFSQHHVQRSNNASERIQEFVRAQLDEIAQSSTWTADSAAELNNSYQHIQFQAKKSESQLRETMGSVNSVRQQVTAKITQDLKSLEATSTRISSRVQQEIDEFQRGIKAPMDELIQFVTSSFETQQRLISEQHEELTQLRSMLQSSASATQNVVEEQQQAISEAFLAEQTRTEEEQNKLIEQVSQMMQQYVSRVHMRQRDTLNSLRSQKLPKIVASVSQSFGGSLGAIEKLHEQSSAQKSALEADNAVISSKVSTIAGCIDRYYGSASETASQIQTEIMRGIETKSGQISRNMDGLDDFLRKIEQETESLSAASASGVKTICQSSLQALSTMSTKLSTLQQRVEAWNDGSGMAELTELWNQVEKEASEELEKIGQIMASLATPTGNSMAPPSPTKHDADGEVPRVPLNDISPVKRNKKPSEERIEKVELPMKRANRFGLPVSKRMVPSRD